MQSLLLLTIVFGGHFLIDAALLKSPMMNQYPQVAVLGCDSRKANLYYDIDRKVWVEHLISPCVQDEQSILEFCQQAYPSLRIGNILRLDTVLRFENWCELTSPIDQTGNNIHRCKKDVGVEETVQPFRCLYLNSAREEITLPDVDCSMNSIIGTGECYRPEQWQKLASESCQNRSMNLNHSIMTMDWCGLSSFRGIEFICCPTKKFLENDYETSLDEIDDQNNLIEDDPIPPNDSSRTSRRRIIAMTLGSRNEPNWMEDYRRWSSDPAYFADDEDNNGEQILINTEQKRFNREKDEFQRKFKEQIDQLRSRWQKSQNELRLVVARNASEAQRQTIEIEEIFRREYELIKTSANRERTRLNEIHETHLDLATNKAKNDANEKLIRAWNSKPIKTEILQDALYNYLQIFLRDRTHLVNRYERLRAVDPEQAEKQRDNIHQRLKLINERINEALTKLRQTTNLQMKIQPSIDALFSEFDEVNQAAEKLLTSYSSSSTTTTTVRPAFGRDEKKIYPFSTSTSTSLNDYDYATNDEYDEDDDDDDDDDDDNNDSSSKSSSSSSSTTLATSSSANDGDLANYDQIETGDSDWDTRSDTIIDVDPIDEQNQQAFITENDIRPLMPSKRLVRNYFLTYLPYLVGCLFLLCLIIGIVIFRWIKSNRSYRNAYEKNYVFTEVDSSSPEDKALQALQMNGYENPTYKFFESQTGKC